MHPAIIELYVMRGITFILGVTFAAMCVLTPSVLKILKAKIMGKSIAIAVNQGNLFDFVM